MSHADKLTDIIERERAKQEALDPNPALTAAIRRAHDTELESARQIEAAEEVMALLHAAKHRLAERTFGRVATCAQLGCAR